MRKNNVVFVVAITAVSVFLLWLWFYLGFNMIDSPLDLVLSIIWWVVIAVAAALIAHAEKRRQQAIRTVLVSDGRAFNPELGIIEFGGGGAVASIEKALEKLEYGFKSRDLPEETAKTCSAVVKSSVFKVRRPDGCNGTRQIDWEGEVVFTATGKTCPFSSREEFEKILAT